jgi:hypothetical protein
MQERFAGIIQQSTFHDTCNSPHCHSRALAEFATLAALLSHGLVVRGKAGANMQKRSARIIQQLTFHDTCNSPHNHFRALAAFATLAGLLSHGLVVRGTAGECVVCFLTW